jgi:hypothetical protein
MSGAERALPIREHDRAAQRYGTIVVVGGGCYGAYYVRQLLRARDAGAIEWEGVRVVDRDPSCRVARDYLARSSASADSADAAGIELVVSAWREFFAEYLAGAALDRDASERDAIVPSPLMPHLMYEWLVARARARHPDWSIAGRPLDDAPQIPWQRAAPDGTHLVSFAEWMCPINCIEPARCPKTRGDRSWSMPPAMHDYVAAQRARGRALAGPIVFHCTHRVYGVGMFDTRDVVAADDLVAGAEVRGEADLLVATVSHCHGIMNRLTIVSPQP